MSITKDNTQKIVVEFGKTNTDTGSVEVQVAILTHRIKNLTSHFENNNKKDFQSRRGLLSLVHKRTRLLQYLKIEDNKRYLSLIEKLGLRK